VDIVRRALAQILENQKDIMWTLADLRGGPRSDAEKDALVRTTTILAELERNEERLEIMGSRR
jgi:hypothetical protein